MLEGIKKKIQDGKIAKARVRLEEETAFCKDRYLGYIREVEPTLFSDVEGTLQQEMEKHGVEMPDNTEAGSAQASQAQTKLSLNVFSYAQIQGEYPFQNISGDILIFAAEPSGMDARAKQMVLLAFAAHPTWDMLYADEDYAFEGNRVAPFMKPDFSPDTLMAFPYYGQFFALRRKAFATLEWLTEGKDEKKVYDFLLKAMVRSLQKEAGEIGHLPLVLYHNPITQEEVLKYRILETESYSIKEPREITADENLPWSGRLYCEDADYDAIRINAARLLHRNAEVKVDTKGIRQLVFEPEQTLVSIVIPSKDNPEVLERLLVSIKEHTKAVNYEIIVVDNGSSGRVRTRLMIFANQTVPFEYLYQPMDFNFSAMVNLGVSKAKGEYILLLNDDTQVLSDDWLSTMLGQACLPHVGAVGAKLLYPDSDLIQHTGVTNLAVGPAHKLQEKSDGYSYYYGRNRRVYDYVGVTAACLLVKKSIYEEVQGFDEEIRVAFNDVDFCFKLIEKGYYNVMRPDVILYHYESLSRGNDLLSDEKKKRMLSERDKLYEKHEWIWGMDPFCSKNLLGNAVDYVIKFQYAYERESFRTPFVPFTEPIRDEWYNDSIYITIEHCKLVDPLEERNVPPIFHISGWCYVLNQDNCRYEMSMMLRGQDGSFLEAKMPKHWRPDVVQILPEQVNVQMSGFLARVNQADLPKGEYEIYLFLKDTCSRQRLLKSAQRKLIVE